MAAAIYGVQGWSARPRVEKWRTWRRALASPGSFYGGGRVIVVIGAGATGLGVAWDLSLRGWPVTVVEMGDIGHGTSGRFHGLLHSGARYVVSDPAAARACIEENRILRRIAPDAVQDSGGYFVELADDSEEYLEPWVKGCQAAGIPAREESLERLRRRVPGLNPRISRAFWVPDAVLEGFRFMHSLSAGIQARGGTILTRHRVVAVAASEGRVNSVTVEGLGMRREIGCDAVISAAGPWAEEVAEIMGSRLSMRLSSGMMLIFAHRQVDVVVNLLAAPGDGDILVPHQAVAILGTTDEAYPEPESPRPTREKAQRLLALGSRLFPDMARWRVLRAFTGVRPLYDPTASTADPRKVSRDFAVIDHGLSGGIKGTFSVVGGKWTTFRLMAERVGDLVGRYLGNPGPCLTRETPLPSLGGGASGHASPVLPTPVVCECEEVSEGALRASAADSLETWRTTTWSAMGPCQGTACGHRLAALQGERHGYVRAEEDLFRLRQERLKGMRPVLWGDNARQWALQRAVRLQTLGEGEAP